jgi:hypothetical protein
MIACLCELSLVLLINDETFMIEQIGDIENMLQHQRN